MQPESMPESGTTPSAGRAKGGGMPQREVAEALDISHQRVLVIERNAMQKIRRRLPSRLGAEFFEGAA